MNKAQLNRMANHYSVSGNLISLENNEKIPFNIKRVFYIYGMKAGQERGNHSNLDSSFYMICLKGKVEVTVDNGVEKQVYELNSPEIGLYIPRLNWKKMNALEDDSILIVISDCEYNKGEYIYSYEEFLALLTER